MITGLSKPFFKGLVWLYSTSLYDYFLPLKDAFYRIFHDCYASFPTYDVLLFFLCCRENDIEDQTWVEVGSQAE